VVIEGEAENEDMRVGEGKDRERTDLGLRCFGRTLKMGSKEESEW
jgi:hypothetical protein